MVGDRVHLHRPWNTSPPQHPRMRAAMTVAAMLLARSAPAAPPTSAEASRGPVRLRLDGGACTALRLDDVLPFAEVEVGHRLAPAEPDDDAILVRCTGDLVSIHATTTDKTPRSYRTDLGRTPPSIRPRVVAIAIAEVVHDLEIGPARRRAPEPEAGPERREQPLEVPVPTMPPTADTRLGLFLESSHFQRGDRWLTGGGLRFDHQEAHWSVGLDAAVIVRDEI